MLNKLPHYLPIINSHVSFFSLQAILTQTFFTSHPNMQSTNNYLIMSTPSKTFFINYLLLHHQHPSSKFYNPVDKLHSHLWTNFSPSYINVLIIIIDMSQSNCLTSQILLQLPHHPNLPSSTNSPARISSIVFITFITYHN